MNSNYLIIKKSSIVIRLFFCLFVSVCYLLTSFELLVFAMFVIAIYSFKIRKISDSDNVLLSLVVTLQLVWTILVFFVFIFDVSPLKLTNIREGVLRLEYKELVLLMSSQFLFILTALLYSPYKYMPKPTAVYTKGMSYFLYLMMWVTTVSINSQGVIFDGGYSGNHGDYWSGLPAIFIVVTAAWILHQKDYNFQFFLMLNSLVFWWLLSGNRSEILILLIYGNFLYLNSYRGLAKYPKLMTCTYVFLLSVAFLIFSFIGELRVEGASGVSGSNISSLLGNVLSEDRINIQTFGASIYSAIVAVHYANINGYIWGESFFGQIINTVPSFIPMPWERYAEISGQMREYQIIGGLGVLGESYLNFGLVGPVIFASLFSLLLMKLVRYSSNYFLSSWFFLSLILYSPRFILYGYVYLHNLIFFFVFIYFITFILAKLRKVS